jgi:hypothetical protein
MLKKSRLLGIVSTISVLFSTGVQVWASCVLTTQFPPCFEYWQTSAVFIATAIEVRQKPYNWDSSFMPPPLLVKLKIDETFKGIEEKEVTLDQNSCEYQFKEGEKYLVYAHRNPNDKKLHVPIGHTRTQPLSEAADDLQYLRSLMSGEKQPVIVGTVGQRTADIKLILDPARHYKQIPFLRPIFEGKPAPGVKVFAEGKDEVYETLSDGAGFYQFFDLPDAEYRIRAEFPSYFSTKTQTVKTKSQGCALGYLGAERKGAIGGKILDENGNPIKDVSISLVFADAEPSEIFSEDDNLWWISSVTRENGEYEFVRLPAGNYFIIVNRNERKRTYGSEAAKKLPRLFYPSVTALEKAAVVSLKEGEQLKGKDFRLPKTNQ